MSITYERLTEIIEEVRINQNIKSKNLAFLVLVVKLLKENYNTLNIENISRLLEFLELLEEL